MSDDPTVTITAAQAREAAARARFLDSLHVLQDRLKPANLARDVALKAVDAGQGVAQRAAGAGQAAARNGADLAQRNPTPIAGAAAVLVLFLARKRIAGLFRRKPRKVPAAPINHSI